MRFSLSVLWDSFYVILSSEVNDMDFFGFDWNGNGEHDLFDDLMTMKRLEEMMEDDEEE